MPRVWFVTGSSRGLGLSLSKLILDLGDSLVATARKAQDLDALVSTYGPDRVLALPLDVTDPAAVDTAIADAVSRFGRIDIVVNNAGYADNASVEDTSLASFRAQIDTNFYGVVYVSKAVIPVMRRQEGSGGHIIQISSLGGRVGSPGLGAYQSAKWAVNGFSTVLSAELAPLGIKVTSCEPGGISTDWAGSSMGNPPISEGYEQTVGAFRTMRDTYAASWTTPEEIAAGVYHIAGVEEPPVRLLLGKDTVAYARGAREALAASDEKWEHVTTLQFEH